MKKLTAQEKKNAVTRIVFGHEPVFRIAKEFKVARKTIYGWIRRYKENYDTGLSTFRPRYAAGAKHPRTKYVRIEKSLLSLIGKKPDTSIGYLSRKLGVSTWTVWKLLDRLKLRKTEERRRFSEEHKKKILNTSTKKEIVLRVINNKEKVSRVSREMKIARKTIYEWVKRFRETEDSREEILAPRYARGTRHPRAIKPEIENELLLLVAESPKMSIDALTRKVPLSSWTVWNILHKYKLNTQEERLLFAYANTKVQPSVIPEISIEISFGFVSHSIELLLSLTRKIPKLIYSFTREHLKEFGQFIYSYYGFLINYAFSPWIVAISAPVPGKIRHDLKKLSEDIVYFNFALFRYLSANPAYTVSYALLIILVLISGRTGKVSKLWQADLSKPVAVTDKPDNFEVSTAYMTLTGNNDYRLSEKPKFYIKKKGGIAAKAGVSVTNVLGIQEELPQATLVGNDATQNLEVTPATGGSYEVNVPGQMDPGKYIVNISGSDGANISQDISWGTLLIDTDKSGYLRGDTVKFAISVLDSGGKPVCDADLAMTIDNGKTGRSFALTSADRDILKNPECLSSAKTVKPDYEAAFKAEEDGNYAVKLIALVGTEKHTASAEFTVGGSTLTDFEVSRASPIRVGMGEDYPVVISIKANRDYMGVITDRLPKSFLVKPFAESDAQMLDMANVIPHAEFITRVSEKDQTIIWNVDFKKGQTYTLTYSFSDLGTKWSDYFLGPVVIADKSIDKKWEFIPDANMPRGRVTNTGGYGNYRAEDLVLKLKNKELLVAMPKVHFTAGETPSVKIRQLDLITESSGVTFSPTPVVPGQKYNLNLKVKDIGNNLEYETQTDNINISLDIPLTNLKPGKHTTVVTDTETGNSVEQSFFYGVLALNLDKTVFAKGESAYIQMASLDDSGRTICNSNLELTIYAPDGSIKSYYVGDGTITHGKYCLNNNVTDEPDYYLYRKLEATGEYKFELTNLSNGYSINGKFKAEDLPGFSLSRKGATRINPFKSEYTMNISVIAADGFSGKLMERVPDGFDIKSGDFELSKDEKGYVLSWPVNTTAGETDNFSYTYQAPKVSPELYLLGPLQLESTNKTAVFTDLREWHLASDASEYITSGSTWFVPADWNDANNTIEVIGGGAAGVTGGSNATTAGGGGGGGAYGKSVNQNMPEGTNVTVNIGSGGASSAANGGDTYICNSTSNCGSYSSSAVVASARGGTGGTSFGGSGGDITGLVFGSGAVEYAGGKGGDGARLVKGRGGGGGGGAAGINGVGKIGGNSIEFAASGGGGGGGNSGGANGSNSTSINGAGGGYGNSGSGGGIGGTGETSCASGGNGSSGSSGGGGGGGGGVTSTSGGACIGGSGSKGTDWAGAGSGGGGGGGGGNTRTSSNNNHGGSGGNGIANTGGGGGGGGSCSDTGCNGGVFGAGGSGIIVINYTPNNAPPTINLDQPDGVNDTVTQGSNFTVQYDVADADNTVTANFYYDTDNSGLNGTSIAGCQNQGENANWTCTWDTTGVAGGNYYVYGTVSDGVNPQVSAYSSGVVTINSPPTAGSVTLNGGTNINLLADTTQNVSFTATVSDANGYQDIVSAAGKMYRSGVGSTCSANDNNCYSVASCSLSSCSGNSCTATCTVSVKFFADATDSGTYLAEYWLAWIQATDSLTQTGSGTSPASTTEMNSLLTISTTSPIAYGNVSAGSNSSLQTITATNTGNQLLDLRLSGNDMCTDYPTCSGSSISVMKQEFASSSFVYGSGTFLRSNTQDLDINISKSSVMPSNSGGIVYWILGVPSNAVNGSYTGSNTIISIVSP